MLNPAGGSVKKVCSKKDLIILCDFSQWYTITFILQKKKMLLNPKLWDLMKSFKNVLGKMTFCSLEGTA